MRPILPETTTHDYVWRLRPLAWSLLTSSLMNSTEQRDAYLDSVLIGGREAVNIRIEDYDAAWPRRFAAVRRLLSDVLGARSSPSRAHRQHCGTRSCRKAHHRRAADGQPR